MQSQHLANHIRDMKQTTTAITMQDGRTAEVNTVTLPPEHNISHTRYEVTAWILHDDQRALIRFANGLGFRMVRDPHDAATIHADFIDEIKRA